MRASNAWVYAVLGTASVAVSSGVQAAISYSVAESTYSENFDGLPTGTNPANGFAIPYNATAHIQTNTAGNGGAAAAPFPGGWKDDMAADATYLSLPGWHLYHQATVGTDTGNGYYTTGGANGHAHFRYGTAAVAQTPAYFAFATAAGDAEKSLGIISATSTNGSGGRAYFGLQLINNTGETMKGFTVQYDGEQWRNGGTALALDGFDFQYSLTKTEANWIDSSGYDGVADSFLSPNDGAAAGLDGNLPGNRIADITHTITGIEWLPGTELWIRWRDRELGPGGNTTPDDGIAIDNVRFSATAVPEPTSLAVVALGGLALASRRRRNATGL